MICIPCPAEETIERIIGTEEMIKKSVSRGFPISTMLVTVPPKKRYTFRQTCPNCGKSNKEKEFLCGECGYQSYGIEIMTAVETSAKPYLMKSRYRLAKSISLETFNAIGQLENFNQLGIYKKDVELELLKHSNIYSIEIKSYTIKHAHLIRL
jgi:ribosomal protein S27AE